MWTYILISCKTQSIMQWADQGYARKAAIAVFIVAIASFTTLTSFHKTGQASSFSIKPMKKPTLVPSNRGDSQDVETSEQEIGEFTLFGLISGKSDTSESNDESLLSVIPVPLKKPDSLKPVTHIIARSTAIPPVPSQKPLHENNGQELSEANKALYQKIFLLQEDAKWKDADALYSQLTDFRLRGHLRYQRLMHPTGYRASFDELKNWMDLYSDLPNAHKVYKLAMARLPQGYTGHVQKPKQMKSIRKVLSVLQTTGKYYKSSKRRSYSQRDAIRTLSRRIDRDLARGAPTKAYLKLRTSDTSRYLDDTEYDRLKAKIANSYMHAGKLAKARELAEESSLRSGVTVPLAGWVAGLVHWRAGNYREAIGFFETTANSPYASAWTQAAGAYWASRAHMRAGRIRDVNKWLEKAAYNPRTFYGLIAARTLGWNINFNWNIPAYREHHAELLQSIPAAKRAIALVDIGQFHLAEQELRRLDMKDDPFLREALLAYSYKSGLASLAMRMAEAYEHPAGGLYDAGLFPVCPWEPEDGYNVDRALIHALIRQESRFNPLVESHSGAVGLMQLMPRTATYVAKDRRYLNRAGQHSLKNPQTNLSIGQQYISALLGRHAVDTELFSLVIAYNAGPGNLRKWKREFASMQSDPLLFIESIPMAETRAFLERVMANYWIYRHRFNQPTPSLDAVARGHWAQYVQLDQKYEPQIFETTQQRKQALSRHDQPRLLNVSFNN